MDIIATQIALDILDDDEEHIRLTRECKEIELCHEISRLRKQKIAQIIELSREQERENLQTFFQTQEQYLKRCYEMEKIHAQEKKTKWLQKQNIELSLQAKCTTSIKLKKNKKCN
jgi:hypothetical protein